MKTAMDTYQTPLSGDSRSLRSDPCKHDRTETSIPDFFDDIELIFETCEPLGRSYRPSSAIVLVDRHCERGCVEPTSKWILADEARALP